MPKRVIKWSILVLTIAIVGVSCRGKNWWKLPSSTQFQITINQNSSENDKLQFNSGHLLLREIEFSGLREEGEDIYFSRNYEGALYSDIVTDNNNPELLFDIPQGTYTSIKIDIQTADYGLRVGGQYEQTPIDLWVTVGTLFETSLNSSVVLKHNTLSRATITLDPIYWFEEIQPAAWSNATLTEVGGTETIVIDSSNNVLIYNKIINRLNQNVATQFSN